MQTKTVYSFDENNKYNGTVVLDESDMSPSGNFNVPARTTEVEVLPEKEGYDIKWDGSAWSYEITKEKAEEEERNKPKEYTLEETKEMKISSLKSERDTKEEEPVEYNGYTYDYDTKAKNRINAAIVALELQGEEATISWTTATNENVILTALDLRNIIALAAERSNKLHVAYIKAKSVVEDILVKELVEAVSLDDYME